MKDLQYYFNNSSESLTDRDFQKIYMLSSRQLYGVILRILKNKELSEECLQEVFVKIYHNLSSYDSTKAQPLTWMTTIARNYTIDYMRKKQLPIEDDYDLRVISDSQIAILEEIESSEHKQQLVKCLKELNSHVRQAVYQIYYNGLSYEELATQYGKPLNTVKAWVFRGLPKLKQCMERWHER